MTTIAFDGRYIACDSQVSSGDYKGTAQKWVLVQLNGAPALCMGAGPVSDITRAFNQLRAGIEPTQEDVGDSTIVVVRGGCVWWYTGDKPAFSQGGPDVDGSGALAALTAMHLGLRADEAVDAACSVDLYSGGPVYCWDVKTLKPVKARKARRFK